MKVAIDTFHSFLPGFQERKDGLQTLTSFINGSKEYNAGLLPDASSNVRIRFFSNSTLVNLAALAVGIPLFVVNLLFLNTGFVNTKSNALTPKTLVVNIDCFLIDKLGCS